MDLARRVEHRVETCQHCGESHTIVLEVVTAIEVPLFAAGGPSAENGPASWTVGAICPATGKSYLEKVTVRAEPGRPVLAVRLASADPAGPAHAELLGDEVAELVKQSSSTVRDFCKAMLTVSFAAIPAVFAVARYLGADRVTGGWAAWLGAATALLFLGAGLTAAVAMRPWHIAYSTLDGYAAERERRLHAVNTLMLATTLVFGLAALTAIVLFVLLLVGS